MTDETTASAAPTRLTKQKRRLPPLAADMAVCFAACFFAYAYYIDNPDFLASVSGLNNFLRLFTCAALAAVWLVLSVQNGAAGRSGFLAFTIMFWTVPLATGLILSAFDFSSATGITAQALNLALLFIKIVVQSPMAGIDFINNHLTLNLTNSFAVCALTAVFTATFLLSYLFNSIKNKKSSANIDNTERSGQYEK